MCKVSGVFVILVVVNAAIGLPARDELMFDLGGDTAVVESTVRETRAVPEHIEDLLQPGVKDAYLHTYGDAEGDDDDIQGYSKKSNDKGSDGYKHFDSFHKKDGDKYGFETHSEYGKAHGAEAGAKGKSAKYSDADHENSEDEGEETKKSYQVAEELYDDGKKRKAVEDYEGDVGYYADSGDADEESESEGYTDGGEEGAEESENYSEGGDGESENYESESEDDGDSGHYTSDDGDSGSYTAAEYDDGESQGYTAEEDDGDY